MEQLFFAGKAYLKINSLVKTPLHEFMAVERSGLWAPDDSEPQKNIEIRPKTEIGGSIIFKKTILLRT